MEKIEATGRTLEEAIAVAAHNLGVAEDGIEYEVVEEGAKGFLGMGQQPTLINAWVKEEEAPETAPAASDATHTEAVCNLLTEILTAMGMNVECEITEDNEEEIDVSVSGEDTALLIGKQGTTLEALQYLVSIAVNRNHPSRRVIIDAGGYKKKHNDSLIAAAKKYADRVKEYGQEAELAPQPARDRRVIHMALADDPDVYTYSEGVGRDRHVVISPK